MGIKVGTGNNSYTALFALKQPFYILHLKAKKDTFPMYSVNGRQG